MQLHNETVNIYSHLLPALGMLALLAGGSWQPWAGSQPAFAFNVASIWLCFMLSACFHTCMANHYCYDRWLKIDVCSVLLVLVGALAEVAAVAPHAGCVPEAAAGTTSGTWSMPTCCFCCAMTTGGACAPKLCAGPMLHPSPAGGGHGVLWWGLHCQPLALRAGFTLAYCLAGGACIIYSLRAGTATQRAGPMLVLLLIRLASFATRAALSAAPSSALRHYLAMEACSLLGGLINVLRVPERWLQPTARDQPAPLDYFGNSHQLMWVGPCWCQQCVWASRAPPQHQLVQLLGLTGC